MGLPVHPETVDFPQLGIAVPVDDGKPGTGSPKVDMPVRNFHGGIAGGAIGIQIESTVGNQLPEPVFHRCRRKHGVTHFQRQFRRGADQMQGQNVRIDRIDHGRFGEAVQPAVPGF